MNSKITTEMQTLNKEDYSMQASITSKDMVILAKREYDKLMLEDKEELIRMIMGTESYIRATIGYKMIEQGYDKGVV